MKHYIKVVATGICLGIILVVIRNVFQIERDAFLWYYLIAAAVTIVGAVVVNLFYNIGYQKKMKAATVLLDEGRPEEYIAAVEGLLEKAKGRNLKNTLRLNLTAGYCDLKQFDCAIGILEELCSERLMGIVKMVHRLNLCVCYFYTHQNAKAMKVYETSQKDFEPFRKTPYYGGNVAVIDMFAEIAQGQYGQAAQLLEYARKTWKNPRLEDDYHYIEELLERESHDGSL